MADKLRASSGRPVNNAIHQENSSKNDSMIVYIYSNEYVKCYDQISKIENRASMTHSLISTYGLLEDMKLMTPKNATEPQLMEFHTREYVEFLKEANDMDDCEKVEDSYLEFGLGYDCPVIPKIYDYVSMVGGATITAAKCLVDEECNVAINWGGGWHHAKKDEAAGFCYVNDIVLGILKLREKFERVLYVDLDLHHGDGVEDAFCHTSKVMTVSFHKYDIGFFPGSGSLHDNGFGRGKYYTVNVPLKDGVQDDQYCYIFTRIMNRIKERFRPDAVVCQCGADTLAGDPMMSFNLTIKGLSQCVHYILNWNLPVLFLGGGGYHMANAARCWCYLTSIITKRSLSMEIPEHEYFTHYGPDFQLDVSAGFRPNENDHQYVEEIMEVVLGNLDKIS